MIAPALSEPQQQHLFNIGIVELISQQAAQDLFKHRTKSDIAPSNLERKKFLEQILDIDFGNSLTFLPMKLKVN
jgi:hypothetical protein